MGLRKDFFEGYVYPAEPPGVLFRLSSGTEIPQTRSPIEPGPRPATLVGHGRPDLVRGRLCRARHLCVGRGSVGTLCRHCRRYSFVSAHYLFSQYGRCLRSSKFPLYFVCTYRPCKRILLLSYLLRNAFEICIYNTCILTAFYRN